MRITNQSMTSKTAILADQYLTAMYRHVYTLLATSVEHVRKNGPVVEIGAGPGLAKLFVDDIVTADIEPSDNVDICLDATRLPFQTESIAGLLMKDSLHHIPQVELFLDEAQRVLVDDGLVAIVDPYWGFLSRLVYKYIHQERYDDTAPTWSFDSSSPWDSNQALSYLLLSRDRAAFERRWPSFEIVEHGPLLGPSFLLSGGVSRRTIVSGRLLASLFAWENRQGAWMNPLRFEYFFTLRKRPR